MKKTAFTLAEVLITLAIIGIIAAITIPSMVASHQKAAIETAFAKFYRTLLHAKDMAIAEHGDMTSWDWKQSYTTDDKNEFVKKYFLPYLNVGKFCLAGTNEKCAEGIIHAGYISGSQLIDITNVPRVILADGTFLNFGLFPDGDSQRNMGFHFDVNGVKKPNVIGKDTFAFDLYKETNEILPHGLVNYGIAYNSETGYTKYTDSAIVHSCKNNSLGWTRTACVVKDGFKIVD